MKVRIFLDHKFVNGTYYTCPDELLPPLGHRSFLRDAIRFRQPAMVVDYVDELYVDMMPIYIIY